MLNRIGNYFSSSEQNANQVRLEASAEALHGRGVISGLTMSGSGLVLTIGTGVYHLLGSAYVVGSSLSYTVPGSSTVSIWIDEFGTVSHTTSSADISDLVCLGRITATSSITSVTESGRNYLLRTDSTAPGVYKIGGGLYFDGQNTKIGIGTTSPATELEVVGTSKTSTATITGAATVGSTLGVTGATTLSSTLSVSGTSSLHTITASGTITATGQIPNPTNVQTLTSNKTLSKDDANLQIITASGANRKVFLPGTMDWGTNFIIRNVGTSNNVIVRDPTDTWTVATLTPGQSAIVNPVPPDGGGAAVWPDTVTPSDGSGGMGPP